MMMSDSAGDAPQGEKDGAEGTGNPVSEGETTAAAAAVPEAAFMAQRQPEPGPTDDSIPQKLLPIATQAAEAEAKKPIAAAMEDLYSPDPAKVKARAAIVAAYEKAIGIGSVSGELWTKYALADEKFVRAAADMEESLVDWIARQLTAADGMLRMLLNERAQVGDRLATRSGPRERTRSDALIVTRRWADRHADWSAPGTKMLAQIGSYIDKIDKLNADINNDINKDQAIFIFWFEIAPKHLQLRPDAVNDANAPGYDVLQVALPAALADRLESGVSSSDGRLYLIDPADLAQHRAHVVDDWTEAATEQAAAEAAYKLAPDDAASLKTRFDKLRDDAWIAVAKPLLEKPVA